MKVFRYIEGSMLLGVIIFLCLTALCYFANQNIVQDMDTCPRITVDGNLVRRAEYIHTLQSKLEEVPVRKDQIFSDTVFIDELKKIDSLLAIPEIKEEYKRYTDMDNIRVVTAICTFILSFITIFFIVMFVCSWRDNWKSANTAKT
jgi:hypothetical protein